MDLSIVIPAYKEGQKIRRDVFEASSFLRARGLRGEIIVVDDGSPDDTVAVLQSLLPEFPELRVLTYRKNRGKGHALRCGVTQAQGATIMFADAGMCVPYEVSLIGLAMLDLEICDVAQGSRSARGSVRRAQPLYRRIGSRVFHFLVHLVMGIPHYITDTQCGFKMYKRDVAHELYGSAFTDGFMFDTEIILRALKSRYTILEFPVLWSNDADTRFDPVKGSVRNFKELAAIWWSLATKAVRPSHELEPLVELRGEEAAAVAQ